ncbi:Fc receptor-like protein 2 [Polyodon spathula]|uniref:Fc receptor-like protein 2 n=1 Tax=Polyodon spathula TaxID=7913 RepID=UPI001B7F6C43|nr:Fc receptor-like protein 2 [Polyodon spathula]
MGSTQSDCCPQSWCIVGRIFGFNQPSLLREVWSCIEIFRKSASLSLTYCRINSTRGAPPDPEVERFCSGQSGVLTTVACFGDDTADKPKSALIREPAREIFEGDTVTLSCIVEGGSDGWRYLWYKDSQSSTPVYQTDSSSGTGAGYTISAAAVSHSGEYWCRAERGSKPFYSQYSNAVRIQVSQLFSRVTLSASPRATVKEGEALNLTCEATMNKPPRSQLHYTILRDGEPVINSTGPALYSIASTEKSHAGSYTCAVESQGVRKSSQELQIEVQMSWQSAVAIGYRVSFTLYHFILFTLLLLHYCRIQGFLRIAGGRSRITWDQDQEQSAEGIELSSRVQHTGVELE